MLYIGIDCGNKGAAAEYNTYTKHFRIFDFTKEGHLKALACNVSETNDDVIARREQFNARPKEGVTSAMRSGYNQGIIDGIFMAVTDIEKVSPANWQTAVGLAQSYPGSNAYYKQKARKEAHYKLACILFRGANLEINELNMDACLILYSLLKSKRVLG